ncbi:MAG: PspA/IM30 family protein [Clostridiales Family XIII bacterium]|jgi:phage shock protein A|nr:PspA/IM30 family protein [Clostridiales Family XIII bacterium]
MGILNRAKDILSANVNALFDSWEDPAKMADQYLRNMTADLAEAKQQTAGVMAEEKRAKRALEDNAEKIAQYDGAARNALKHGNDADAAQLVAKKQQLAALRVELEKTYLLAKDNADKMVALHDKLVRDIEALNARRASIKAKAAVAKTQEKANKLGSGGAEYGAAMGKFDDLEARVDARLDTALSVAELSAGAADETADLVAKYQTNSQSVEDELAAMKAEMGI